jgi:poly(3-hydroxybutyrate) depolymerase
VAIWYGSADTTVPPVNATELRDQWTDVWGIGQFPSGSTALPGGTTAETYPDASGHAAVQLYRVPDIGHGTPVDPGTAENQCGSTGTYYPASICSAYYIAGFWGLAD